MRGGKGLPSGGEFLRGIASAREPDPEFGDYPELPRHYLSPWSVFERVRLDRFKGRGWLLQRLDQFLNDNDRGLFLVEAEAGLGKTAFLAHLARERGYVHHFVELARGSDGVEPGIRNMASQLIRAWGLPLDAIVAPLRPNFLQDLLKQAADRRDQDSPNEKIVLVVDALDEAGPSPAGQNALGLPEVLPKGVYLVVSQRPVEVSLATDAPRQIERIDAQSEENRKDIRLFLEAAADWPGIRKARVESDPPVSKESFVATLFDRSQGVWIYLKYVLDEIEAGRRSPLKLDELPQGLWQYYARFWKEWKERHQADWDTPDLPLLTTLAAAQESLTLEDLISLAGVETAPTVLPRLRKVLSVEWSPYLATSPAGPGPRSPRSYRFYHASLREFFAGAIDRRDLSRAEEAFVDELADATRLAHSRISDIFIHRWGGLDAWLPALFDLTGTGGIDGYGLRHLAEHLEAAGREEDLHRLLRLERRVGDEKARTARAENVWFIARERVGQTDGYMNDLARARRLVRVADRSDLESRRLKTSIGLGIRYALMAASLTSVARKLWPSLIAALVEKGVWLPSQGLSYARALLPWERAGALIRISTHPSLDDRGKGTVLKEAMEVVREIRDVRDRDQTLAALVSPLANLGRVEEALEVARGIGDEWKRANALAGLVPRLADLGRVEEALEVARGIGDESHRAQALAALAPKLAKLNRGKLLPLWEETLRFSSTHSRADLLADFDALAPIIAALGGAEAICESCRAIQDVGRWWP